MKPQLIIVQGLTASGKSNAAYALAKELQTDMLSADSRQIYRYATIGTGKSIFPDVKTHLIDVKNPDEVYSAFQFKCDAEAIIKEYQRAKKSLIIVGGTGFYIDVLLGNVSLTKTSEAYQKFQQEMLPTLQNASTGELQMKLKKLNEAFFETLNDSEKYNTHRLIKRIISISFDKIDPNPLQKESVSSFIKEHHIPTLSVGIRLIKEDLQARIKLRIESMFHDGLQQEVITLIEKYSVHSYPMMSIGYKEFLEEAKRNGIALDDTNELLSFIHSLSLLQKQAIQHHIYLDTIHYAKRQQTWLQKNESIAWFPTSELLSTAVIKKMK